MAKIYHSMVTVGKKRYQRLRIKEIILFHLKVENFEEKEQKQLGSHLLQANLHGQTQREENEMERSLRYLFDY